MFVNQMLLALNFTKTLYQDVQHCFQHPVKFPADELKVCEKIKPTGFVLH